MNTTTHATTEMESPKALAFALAKVMDSPKALLAAMILTRPILAGLLTRLRVTA